MYGLSLFGTRPVVEVISNRLMCTSLWMAARQHLTEDTDSTGILGATHDENRERDVCQDRYLCISLDQVAFELSRYTHPSCRCCPVVSGGLVREDCRSFEVAKFDRFVWAKALARLGNTNSKIERRTPLHRLWQDMSLG